MRATRRAALAFPFITILTIGACGEAGEGEEPIEYPECEPGEVRWLHSSPDGEMEGAFSTEGGYVFVNALGGDDPGSLIAGSMDGELLRLEWPTLVANGRSVEARGTLEVADFSAGNCLTGAFVSTMTMDDEGGGGTFVLRGLLSAPFCGGAALEGQIVGCFKGAEPDGD